MSTLSTLSHRASAAALADSPPTWMLTPPTAQDVAASPVLAEIIADAHRLLAAPANKKQASQANVMAWGNSILAAAIAAKAPYFALTERMMRAWADENLPQLTYSAASRGQASTRSRVLAAMKLDGFIDQIPSEHVVGDVEYSSTAMSVFRIMDAEILAAMGHTRASADEYFLTKLQPVIATAFNARQSKIQKLAKAKNQRKTNGKK